MIKFFRHIRKDLMERNKTGKYLKYAVGEIVLVVIGILIALQISNWNESRKLKEQETFYYCKINEDLSNDLLNIERSIATLNERQISTNRFLTNLLKIQDDKSVLLDDYLAAVRSYRFIPSKSAIIDITSSGKLENLKNQDLKNAILNYYSELDNALQIIEGNQKVLSDASRLFNYTDFGIQEVPFYRDSYSKELQPLLKSVNWQRDPNHPIFISLQDEMNITIVICEREKQLINEMKKRAEDLIQKVKPFCF